MMKYFKYAVLSLVLVVSAGSVVIAQGMGNGENALVDTSSNVESVTYYGQTFTPATNEEGSYNTDYTWADMKPYVEEILPEAKTTTKEPQELCEHLDKLVHLYVQNYDAAVDDLAKNYEDILKPETDLQVAQMLKVKSGIPDLIELNPKMEGKVLMAQQAHNQYLGVMMLADGARAKFCPREEKAPTDLKDLK